MRTIYLIFGIASLLMASTGVTHPDTNTSKTQSTVSSDATLLRGAFGEDHISLKTHIGTIRIPTHTIARIRPDKDGQRILFTLRNTDEVLGIPDQPDFTLRRESGTVKIPYFSPDGYGVYLFSAWPKTASS